ncbi:MAG: hypothetical protein ACP5HJ_01740 [Candidatus Micrarchaeia archaeon]|jgi:hypothetical protein
MQIPEQENSSAGLKSIIKEINSLSNIPIGESIKEKQGIIEIMFKLDDNLLASIANVWWDGKLITDPETGEKIIVPNSEYYRCPICKRRISVDTYGYRVCSGTKENPHEPTFTEPENWHPLLSRTGMAFLIGQLQANISTNIQTANFGKSSSDAESRAELDEKLLNIAYNNQMSIIGALLSNPDNIADWIKEDKTYKKMVEVFNLSFIRSVGISLTLNLYASYSKGKGMAAVGRVLDTRTHIEQTITSTSEQEQKNISPKKGGLGGIFNLFDLGVRND